LRCANLHFLEEYTVLVVFKSSKSFVIFVERKNMDTTITTRSFYEKNRKSVQKKMHPHSMLMVCAGDILPRSADQFYPYRANPNLYYLCGIPQPETILLLFPDCPNHDLREVLFISERNEAEEVRSGKRLSKDEAIKISGVKNIMWVSNFKQILRDIMGLCENIYLEYNEYAGYAGSDLYKNTLFIENIRKSFPLHTYYRAYPLIAAARCIKDVYEIALLQEAINITAEAMKRVAKKIKPKLAEYEIEAEITYTYLKNNARNHGFQPIVASGVNACYLHYNENSKICLSDELLLIDTGAEYFQYTSDITRVFPVSGRFNPRQKLIYNAVLKVLKEATSLYVPGQTISDINEEAGKLMTAVLTDIGLLDKNTLKKEGAKAYKKWLPHGIAHFLGMDAHDTGHKFMPLKPGMVLTCEPGIYIFEEEMGIRLENDLLITTNGPLNLSNNIPIEIEEIEEIMNHN